MFQGSKRHEAPKDFFKLASLVSCGAYDLLVAHRAGAVLLQEGHKGGVVGLEAAGGADLHAQEFGVRMAKRQRRIQLILR